MWLLGMSLEKGHLVRNTGFWAKNGAFHWKKPKNSILC